MAVGFAGLLFGLKETQAVSAVYLGNGVSLVRREAMGMCRCCIILTSC